ncbi:MAG: hypothetical protein WD076_11520 [Parvularculaceae bacterium]
MTKTGSRGKRYGASALRTPIAVNSQLTAQTFSAMRKPGPRLRMAVSALLAAALTMSKMMM